jgi:hypothetical protein
MYRYSGATLRHGTTKSFETVRKVKLSTSVKLSSREYGCQRALVVTTEKRASAFVNNEH